MNNLSIPHPLRASLMGCNLYLIGMMGSGKSSTGPSLASKLAYGFVDVDAVITQLFSKSISTIFQDEGEQSFREIESQVLKDIGQRHSLVVATGGGIVTRNQNWGILHQGIVIWLDPGRDRLLRRLESDPLKRPLLNEKDPVVAFDQLFDQRYSLYCEADLHISVGDETPDEVAKSVLEKLSTTIKAQRGRGELRTNTM